MGNARAAARDNSRRQTTVVENYFTDRAVREEFQCLIEDIAPHKLAKAAQCSLDAARLWVAGERTPRASHIFNMAKSIPRVAMWVAEYGGHGNEAWIISELKAMAVDEGPEGQFARRLLREGGIK